MIICQENKAVYFFIVLQQWIQHLIFFLVIIYLFLQWFIIIDQLILSWKRARKHIIEGVISNFFQPKKKKRKAMIIFFVEIFIHNEQLMQHHQVESSGLNLCGMEQNGGRAISK